ncbi:hypothetical protein Catovirus_1_671 [Catovirus CTV1]|uniref:Uncharacterized protein n=1 Tax=Catovirus CTV1 TaxID=1977631 RepID=A0A1V0SAA8_9VIRU|nr:hypothetical protein Catovirus_1_671 [Catovirus CTV1]
MAWRKRRTCKYILNEQKIQDYFNVLKNMSNDDIIKNHNEIKYFNGCNFDVNIPMACGTSANAVMNISLKFFNKEQSNILATSDINLVLELLKQNRYAPRIILYKICVNSLDDDFIGHSFVIIKLPNHEYTIVQSYIGKYSLFDWLTTNNFTLISYKKIVNIIKRLIIFNQNGLIDNSFLKLWKEITNVDYENPNFTKKYIIYFYTDILFYDI